MTDGGSIAKPVVFGTALSIPVWTDIGEIFVEWQDGSFSVGDLGTPVTGALGALGAVLNPIGAITGSVAGYVVDAIVKYFPPATRTLDALAGDPDRVTQAAQGWYRVGVDFQQMSMMHAASIRDVDLWTGAAADHYRQTLQATTKLIVMGGESATWMGHVVNALGVVVATTRLVILEVIKECLSQILQKAIAAGVAAVATGGVAAGAFAAWAFGKVAALMARISELMSRMMRSVAKLVDLLGQNGAIFRRAASGMSRVAQRLTHSSRGHYKDLARLAGGHLDVPKFKAPSDFTAVKDIADKVDKYVLKPVDDFQETHHKGTTPYLPPKDD